MGSIIARSKQQGDRKHIMVSSWGLWVMVCHSWVEALPVASIKVTEIRYWFYFVVFGS
jgi:hypothetical protein